MIITQDIANFSGTIGGISFLLKVDKLIDGYRNKTVGLSPYLANALKGFEIIFWEG